VDLWTTNKKNIGIIFHIASFNPTVSESLQLATAEWCRRPAKRKFIPTHPHLRGQVRSGPVKTKTDVPTSVRQVADEAPLSRADTEAPDRRRRASCMLGRRRDTFDLAGPPQFRGGAGDDDAGRARMSSERMIAPPESQIIRSDIGGWA
jgi:hypothetical protein